MRSRSKVVITLLSLFVLIFLSQTVRCSIQNSLTLCANVLIPSLFPFFIISGMLFDFGINVMFPPTFCSFIVGLVCGFPIGTKCVCQSYQNGDLSMEQANTLLLCTANASPAFIVVAIGETILKNKTLGCILLLCQILNALLIFLLFVPKSKLKRKKSVNVSFLYSLVNNSKAATEQILFVCSMTIVFGIICDVLKLFLKGNFVKIVGLIELVHGSILLESSDLFMVASLVGFSGICIIFQCIYFIKKTDLDPLYLWIGKIEAATLLPQYVLLLTPCSFNRKILAAIIIVLTKFVTMCIIKHKGCEKDDFFKKHRKVLRLLRTRNQGCV